MCEHPAYICQHDGLLQYEALHHSQDHSSMHISKRNICEYNPLIILLTQHNVL